MVDRGWSALRLLAGGGGLVAVVGLLDWSLQVPLLTATVGPTVYVFVAHPRSTSARLRNALLGHGIALAVGVATVGALGLWHGPNPVSTGHIVGRQVIAAAVGVGVTLLLLELVGSHHAPAASTVLLVTTGLAHPGKPLVGLVLGLALVIAAGPLLAHLLPPPPTEDT